MSKTLLRGPFSSRSGYGDKARSVAHSFIALGHTVQLVDVPWGTCPRTELPASGLESYVLLDTDRTTEPDLYVNIDLPSSMQRIGKRNVLFTSGVEATAILPEWIHILNETTDQIIVPSTFIKSVFETSEYLGDHGKLKLNVPVDVVPESYCDSLLDFKDDSTTRINETLSSIAESFCFLHVGQWIDSEMFQDRKDISSTIKVFLETFRNTDDAPALLLKVNGASSSILDIQAIRTKVDHIRTLVSGKLPSVYVLHGEITDAEMGALYTHPKVKCFVSFTRGEGFGRPILEASVLGLPVVVSGWSGHLDFTPDAHATLLPGKLVPINMNSVQPGIFPQGAQWFNVDYVKSKQILLDVFKRYHVYTAKAKELRPLNRSRYSHSKCTNTLKSVLHKN